MTDGYLAGPNLMTMKSQPRVQGRPPTAGDSDAPRRMRREGDSYAPLATEDQERVEKPSAGASDELTDDSALSPARDRSPVVVPIGTLTAGALLVVCGVLYLLEDAGLVGVSWRLVGSVALTVIGISLVAGGWWGRPRGLIVTGSILCVVLLVATVVVVPIRGGFGSFEVNPTELGEVFNGYHLAAGTVVLDLRDVEIETSREVRVSVGAGQLRVVVPFGVEVQVVARVGFGKVVVFDDAGSGVAVERSFVSDGTASGSWVLDLDVGFGKLSVEQVLRTEHVQSGKQALGIEPRQ